MYGKEWVVSADLEKLYGERVKSDFTVIDSVQKVYRQTQDSRSIGTQKHTRTYKRAHTNTQIHKHANTHTHTYYGTLR